MQIWVDADACPRVIKEILFRAAQRVEVVLTLVANQPLYVPRSPFLRTMQVPSGFDEADHRIVQKMEAGDLVVTGDAQVALRNSGIEADNATIGELNRLLQVGEALAANGEIDALIHALDGRFVPPSPSGENQGVANICAAG